jgi:hypothetical protein
MFSDVTFGESLIPTQLFIPLELLDLEEQNLDWALTINDSGAQVRAHHLSTSLLRKTLPNRASCLCLPSQSDVRCLKLNWKVTGI